MTYQASQISDQSARTWAIVRILPDNLHYPIARFYNRSDAQDHLRVLQRFMPTAEFKIVDMAD